MFYSKKCKQCGQDFFSFNEESVQNQAEIHMMRTGHTVIDNCCVNDQKVGMELEKDFFYNSYLEN